MEPRSLSNSSQKLFEQKRLCVKQKTPSAPQETEANPGRRWKQDVKQHKTEAGAGKRRRRKGTRGEVGNAQAINAPEDQNKAKLTLERHRLHSP